ncbi:MAG TPA: ornithine cyclodeaminase family protein [Solirubrobacterales bacterium]|nr:ornithine cyclodeaminase family protein [Solirubrobacterales bacterium]
MKNFMNLSPDSNGAAANGLPAYVSGDELHSLLEGAAAVDALEAGFLARAVAGAAEAPRAVIEHEQGDFLLMPAAGPEGAGAKLVTVVPGNPERGLPLINGIYVLFSRETLRPELLIDGAALTRLRTAAVSALATRHLARPESRRLVVFGAGAQAQAHARMLRQVLPIESVTVVGSSPQSPRATDLVERLRGEGLEARVGAPEDVADADIVCTCTPSTTPVFDSSLLAPGAHVNAVGSYKPTMRELDFELCRRALVVVETLDAAREEAGDLIQAIAAGALAEEGFAHELGEVLRGEVRRADPEQVTLFKSVGLPSEDLIVARAVAEILRITR